MNIGTWTAAAFAQTFIPRAAVLAAALALGGCLEEGDATETAATPDPPAQPADPGPNSAPEITGSPALAIEAGELYSYTPAASDADNDFLEFTIENKPDWAEFSVESGALTGTPPDASVGDTNDITITVTDGRDTRSVGPFKIKINPRNQPAPVANAAPTITGAPAASVITSQAYSFQPTASDADNDALSFSISNRPSWATFSSRTGQISGAPSSTQIGTYANIVIAVSDGRVSAALPAFSIQVRGPDNRAPTISGSPAASVQAGQSYSFTPAASDPDNDALTFAIANRPNWATFNASTGRLSGSPTSTHVGNYANIQISVSDGRSSTVLPAFAINVTAPANRAPTIGGTPTSSINVGGSYAFTPAASDPDGNTLAFSIQNRPSWASFDTVSGRLSGAPGATHVGAYSNIVISVSDGRASTSLASFSITVNAAANNAPSISGSPGTSVSAGAAYTFTPNASDPDGDTLTFSAANLPPWASFNQSTGRISGTPSSAQSGVYRDIIISVSDGRASASLAAFTITVGQSANGSATLNWTAPTQNTDGTALTNLAGFRIMYGTSAGALTQSIEVQNSTVTSYVVNNLGSGTWYFAVKALTAAGAESSLSNTASKTIP